MRRGEVWLFDCGMAEKVRPVLILSIPFADTDRAVVTVVFHSTALRGSPFEIRVQVPFLKEGAFIAQSLAIAALPVSGLVAAGAVIGVATAIIHEDKVVNDKKPVSTLRPLG